MSRDFSPVFHLSRTAILLDRKLSARTGGSNTRRKSEIMANILHSSATQGNRRKGWEEQEEESGGKAEKIFASFLKRAHKSRESTAQGEIK